MTKMKLSPEKYPEVYELAKSGLSDKDIAEHLGVRKSQFKAMCRKDSVLEALVKAGRKHAGAYDRSEQSIKGYLYGKLSPEVKSFWDEIMKVWRTRQPKHDKRTAIEKILSRVEKCPDPTAVRQGLFVHAFINSGFDGTKASLFSGVPFTEYKDWLRNDPGFKKLLEEIDWHKKNFFESSYIRLVKRGVPAAVIHAAKSQLADRGYATTLKFEGQMQHTHEDKVSIEDLNLPIEDRKRLLAAMQAKKRQERLALNPHDPDVIEAEVVEVKPPKRLKRQARTD